MKTPLRLLALASLLAAAGCASVEHGPVSPGDTSPPPPPPEPVGVDIPKADLEHNNLHHNQPDGPAVPNN